MSKFATLMHLLDLKNKEIRDREFPPNVKPFYPQKTCLIKLKLADLNPMCSKCMFCDVITTQGKVNELGIGGYMSNQEDGLKTVKHNPKQGVELKEPRTIIIAHGQAFICRNREQTKTGTFFLTEKEPTCEHFKEKTKFETKE